MGNWNASRNPAAYSDSGPMKLATGTELSDQSPVTESSKLFKLKAELFLLVAHIEASEALYADGHAAKAIQRFDGALPIAKNMIATARSMDIYDAETILAITEDIAVQLKLESRRVANGEYYENIRGKRIPNIVDAIINDLIDDIETC